METPLLQVKELKTYFFVREGTVKAVNNVSFEVNKAEILGIVGESGCGKSVTAYSIMRLIRLPGKIMSGKILLKGKNILEVPLRHMRNYRGNEISMIFQEPMTSLNPVFTIGRQVSEMFIAHQNLSKNRSLEKAIEILELVGISSANKRVNDYPHQFSGGQRQRVMIAMALSCKPSLLIADEPTTSLDVTIQAQILDLISKMKETTGTSVILITHDLGVIAQIAQQVLVMYMGKIVERADVYSLFKKPLHPYTQGLLKAIPYIKKNKRQREQNLYEIPGNVPSLLQLPIGCEFQNRCSYVVEKCRSKEAILRMVEEGHFVSCWLYET